MKEYKLTAWPDLPTEFRRTAYRRMVSELSQRHVTDDHLQKCSGVSSTDVRRLLDHLDGRGMLDSRESLPEKPSGWRTIWPLQLRSRRVS